jgi:hypothetical protein
MLLLRGSILIQRSQVLVGRNDMDDDQAKKAQ